MNHFFDFAEQGLTYFFFYSHLLSLAMILVLSASNTFSYFKRGLKLMLSFFGGSLVPMVFGSLGFYWGHIPNLPMWLLGTILVFSLLNYTLKYKTGYQKKTPFGTRYLTGFFFGLIHGLFFFENFMEIDSSFPHGLVQGMGFAFGLGLSIVLIFLVVLVLNAMFNAFARIKKRDWNLVETSLAIGLAAGFLL